tara:strand:- start:5579 stop:5908 length:330 start_codon:yes stop_codon:yes gene_type:complete
MTTTREKIDEVKVRLQAYHAESEHTTPHIRQIRMRSMVEETFDRRDNELLVLLSTCTGFLICKEFNDIHEYILKIFPGITTTGLVIPSVIETYTERAIKDIEAMMDEDI